VSAAELAAACSTAALLAFLARPNGASLPGCGPAEALRRRPVMTAALVVPVALAAGLPVPVLALGAGWIVGLTWLRRGLAGAREQRQSNLERARVVQFVSGLAAELRAGRDAREAIGRLASTMPSGWSAEVVGAAASAGDVGAALLRAARSPGGEDLREVAACWRVAERSGAGLAAGLETVAASIADRENFRERLDAELAGVRAAGWVLGGLPLLGLVLGTLLGARPWEVVIGSRIGGALCGTGLLLDLLGVCWLRRMIRSVRETS
jgi:tight adherence protein B